MIEIVECLDERGRSPFREWFLALDPQAAMAVTVAIERLRDDNTSRVKTIGEGVAEIRIDRGPGYRIYFGWDGRTLVVLLGGGTKRRQQRDIAGALALWRLYNCAQEIIDHVLDPKLQRDGARARHARSRLPRGTFQ